MIMISSRNILKIADQICHQQKRLLNKDLKQLRSIIEIQPEVSKALLRKDPVVALESTIITHGMKYPDNLEMALKVESIVRKEGAIPATIAIINGAIKIGLKESELELLANTSDENRLPTYKTSRRDLAYVLSKQFNGGTTVAGTIICSEIAGIKVFATGGIGGVHRDGDKTLDISADLVEMGRSNVAVVSSGVKSILDIPKTLEYLETQGVLVSTFQSPENNFPAFYTRTSGLKSLYNFENAEEAANTIYHSNLLNLKSGMLIAVPVPEEFAMDENKINAAIEEALKDAKLKGISGKEVTPFILAAVSKITAGKSLETNKALVQNNARVAAQIAVELSNLENADLGSKFLRI